MVYSNISIEELTENAPVKDVKRTLNPKIYQERGLRDGEETISFEQYLAFNSAMDTLGRYLDSLSD